MVLKFTIVFCLLLIIGIVFGAILLGFRENGFVLLDPQLGVPGASTIPHRFGVLGGPSVNFWFPCIINILELLLILFSVN